MRWTDRPCTSAEEQRQIRRIGLNGKAGGDVRQSETDARPARARWEAAEPGESGEHSLPAAIAEQEAGQAGPGDRQAGGG